MKIEVGDAVKTYNGHVKRVTAVQHPYVTCAWGSGNKSMTGKFHIDELTIYRKAKT